MAYDPSDNPSWRAVTIGHEREIETGEEAFFGAILDAAAPLMDDEIREHLHAEMAPCPAIAFLGAYMGRHYAAYGSHLCWT